MNTTMLMNTTILLVDDHDSVRDGVRRLLDPYPRLTVIGEANDGRAAVRKVSELAPNVVILDISMPLLDGIEATRQILAINPETCVLILSMYSDKTSVSQALAAGASGYLVKTSLAKELVNAIDTVLSGNRYLSQKIEHSMLVESLGYGMRESIPA